MLFVALVDLLVSVQPCLRYESGSAVAKLSKTYCYHKYLYIFNKSNRLYH